MKPTERALRTVKRAIYGPRLRADAHEPVIRCGSKYGGWSFLERAALQGGTILSCGLGEDASFDVELASHYQCRVIIVDPTPRAIEHFRELHANLGNGATTPYSEHGKQSVTSYDLRRVGPNQMSLVEKAIADQCGFVRFYAPPDAASVSFSLVNFQQGYATDTQFMVVEAVDVPTLLREQEIRNLALVKLDIEGAEIGVIPDLLRSGVLPEQLLVEYDELNWPSRASTAKFRSVHKQVLAAGYRVTYFDGRSCVSYAR